MGFNVSSSGTEYTDGWLDISNRIVLTGTFHCRDLDRDRVLYSCVLNSRSRAQRENRQAIKATLHVRIFL
jgi:hypothetical protein